MLETQHHTLSKEFFQSWRLSCNPQTTLLEHVLLYSVAFISHDNRMKRIPTRDCAFWWLHWLPCEFDLSNSVISKQGLEHWQMQFFPEKPVWRTLGLLNYKPRHFRRRTMLFGSCLSTFKHVATASLVWLNSVWRSRPSETAIVANALSWVMWNQYQMWCSLLTVLVAELQTAYRSRRIITAVSSSSLCSFETHVNVKYVCHGIHTFLQPNLLFDSCFFTCTEVKFPVLSCLPQHSVAFSLWQTAK